MDRYTRKSHLQLKYSLTIKVLIGIVLVLGGVIARPVMYVAALYSLIVIITYKDTKDLICTMFAWLNISTIFKFSLNSTSIFTYLELVTILILIIRNRKINKRILLLIFIYGVYVFVGSNFDFATYLKTLMIPLVLYLLLRELNYGRLKEVSFYYILGLLAGSALGLIKSFIPNLNAMVVYKKVNLSYSVGEGFTTSTRFSALWGDPNYYSVHLILAMVIIAILYLRLEIKPITFYILEGLFILLGALTGSKSFLFMAVITVAIFIVLSLKKGQSSRVIAAAGIVLVIVLLTFTGKIDLFSVVLRRIGNANTGFALSGLTTGRTELLQYYFRLFIESPIKFLIGNGIGEGFSYRPPHNTVIDYLDLLGLIGSVIALLLFIVIFSKAPSEGCGSKFVLVVALMFFALSMFYSIDFCFELTLIAAYMRLGPTFGLEGE